MTCGKLSAEYESSSCPTKGAKISEAQRHIASPVDTVLHRAQGPLLAIQALRERLDLIDGRHAEPAGVAWL